MATQYTAGLSTGQVLTAATMNSIGAAWESYTPVIKAGATTMTTTLTYAKYAQLNKTVWVQILATMGSTGAVNGAISFSLPSGLNPVSGANQRALGTMIIEDVGVGFYVGVALIAGDNLLRAFSYNVGDFMGSQGPAMTLVSGDKIGVQVCYEVA